MSNIKERMAARTEGMAYAYKVFQNGGAEALEKEIKYRNVTGVSLNVPRKELEHATSIIRIRATEVAITISLITLLDEFCFSKYQALKFKEVFDHNVDKILNDEATLQDYIERIRNDLNIELVIRD